MIVRFADRELNLSSLDRVLYPATGFTKGDLIAYYRDVASVLLPHIADHPLTLHRYPDGVEGPHFFQTRCPPHPPWLVTQRMYTFRSGKEVDAPVIGDLAGLVWAGNLSTIELHPFLAAREDLLRPRALVFDFDPGPPAGLLEACEVALEVRGLLDQLGLHSFPKTSGWAGVHVYVPVDATHRYEDTKAFARAVAAVLARQRPDRVVDRMALDLRAGKVFVDWSQNDPGKSMVAPYSLRGRPVPVVSTPVTWEEVDATVERRDETQLIFGPGEVLDRLGQHGDRFEGVLSRPQRIPVDLSA